MKIPKEKIVRREEKKKQGSRKERVGRVALKRKETCRKKEGNKFREFLEYSHNQRADTIFFLPIQ